MTLKIDVSLDLKKYRRTNLKAKMNGLSFLSQWLKSWRLNYWEQSKLSLWHERGTLRVSLNSLHVPIMMDFLCLLRKLRVIFKLFWRNLEFDMISSICSNSLGMSLLILLFFKNIIAPLCNEFKASKDLVWLSSTSPEDFKYEMLNQSFWKLKMVADEEGKNGSN